MKLRHFVNFIALGAIPIAVLVACGSAKDRNVFEAGDDAGGGFGDGSNFEGGDSGGNIGGRDPVNCEEAAQFKTYVGCDYWPTVTGNIVAEVFDFAVAIANVGTETANVTVTGPGGVNQKVTVKGGELGKVFLPWVKSLKGSAGNSGLAASVLATNSAYHLVSDKPVVVYQFNPLEFQAVGGPPGKDWSSCVPLGGGPECYSYSNDASLLLPSTAMTGTYRIMGSQGMTRNGQAVMAPYFAVTGTAADTTVEVKLSGTGSVVGGSGISAASAGGTITFKLGAGDVAEIVSGVGKDFDLSGALLKADKPVQVISGVPCMDVPINVTACDHIEETVFPAETLGKHYVVMRPTGPKQNEVGHVVHFFGNVDATTLTYKPSKPAGCPDFLNAGQVADCGEVSADFEVSGNQSFGVGMFQLGGDKTDPTFNGSGGPQGDPSQSFAVAVEQYRTKYVFLAPTDYKTSYVDIVATGGTSITLDGADVSNKLSAISGTDYLRARILLGAGKEGAHVLEGSAPLGIRVLG
ncbi:hypothetical protein BH11MYX4_BH11MYX4_09310 [soil metagenome]